MIPSAQPPEGRVLWGVNNIYTVEVGEALLQCRIKGKVLRTGRDEHNPLAVGDLVGVAPDPLSPGVGWILQRRPRRNAVMRWNKKSRSVQVIAANADLVVCVASSASPPFRPRFVDRVLVAAEAQGLETLVVVNKSDLGTSPGVTERIEDYRRVGYTVRVCSARSGEGVGDLAAALRGRVAVLFGQSGAGKSSLLNRMFPELDLRVGELSAKYDRGAHTTSYGRMFHPAPGYTVVDTPGVREFEVAGVEPETLSSLFRDFGPHAPGCLYPGCQHVEEPRCAVRAAVEQGRIHADRYESYLRLREDLQSFREAHHGSAHA